LEEDGIFYKKMSDNEKIYIKDMHKRFYDKIKNNIKNEFFEKNEANFIKFKYNQ
jgi:hypothetical protein